MLTSVKVRYPALMDAAADPAPDEAMRALRAARDIFGDALLAAYLHGSAVAGGLRPDSDVDLLLVSDRATTGTERARLLHMLMAISARPGNGEGIRPVELILFDRAALSPAAYPARSEFTYGEWLRDAFEAGLQPEPHADPEYTLILAQARKEARPLFGPPLAALSSPIPAADVRRAIGDALPTLLGALDGDERNVVLTLARMWRTLVAGDFVPKHVAAEWAMARLPARPAGLLAAARDAYLGKAAPEWRAAAARPVASDLAGRIAALL